MGNTGSNAIGPEKEQKSFGSISNPDTPRPGYYIGKGVIIYKAKHLKLLQEEDTARCKKLKHGYLSTNLRVFYQGQPIPGANPATFEIVERKHIASKLSDLSPEQKIKISKLNSVVAIDYTPNGQKRIYIEGKLITF